MARRMAAFGFVTVSLRRSIQSIGVLAPSIDPSIGKLGPRAVVQVDSTSLVEALRCAARHLASGIPELCTVFHKFIDPPKEPLV
jgi:hypothetical protein